MCPSGQPAPAPGAAPGTVVAAAVAVEEALGSLGCMDVASVPVVAQADCLRVLERAEARLVAARSRVLSVFSTQDGPAADGQQSARSWLRWQTRVTGGAASAAARWARRLAAHPAVATALAGGDLSVSWAEMICKWTDLVPGAAPRGGGPVPAGCRRGWRGPGAPVGAGGGDLPADRPAGH
jgi:hypothetical protein